MNGKRSAPKSSSVKCPECGSEKLYKDGLRYRKDGSTVQRWLCRNCGFRFSQPNVKVNITTQSVKSPKPRPNLPNVNITSGEFTIKKRSDSLSFQVCEDVGSHNVSVVAKPINSFRAYNRDCQVGDLEKELKNLIATEQKQTVAGNLQTQDVKGKLLQFMLKLHNEGIRNVTIENYAKMLRLLTKKGANLYDPDSIKETIAKQNRWAESTKQLASIIYGKFAQLNGITWKAPRYKANRKIPFIPLESEIDSLVCSCGKKLSALLRLLKESGLRVGEALRLEWKDIDVKKCTITLNNPEKHGVCRMFQVSNELIAILHNIPKKSDRIFGNCTLSSWEGSIALQRRKAAIKLQNPRLLQIHFHTLRHWKATMEYAKTKDILHVMKVLGHRNIQTTLIYTQLINFESNEYHSATAQTIEEASKLIEAGFEYVCKIDNVQLFRKRK